MTASHLVPVLGHARVLSEGLGDARRRSNGLLPYLLDELLGRVQEAGLVAVRFVFATRDQRMTAERLVAIHSHCALRRDWLDIRLEPVETRATMRAAAAA